MRALYPYSLLPVLSVALLLAFTSARLGRRTLGLTLYCAAVATWTGMLTLIFVPAAADIAERFAAVGAFIAATFLHAAYDLMGQRNRPLLAFAYSVAALLTLAGALSPGLLYGPRAMVAGPLFWPSMALAISAAVFPLLQLWRAYRRADPSLQPNLRRLGLAGALAYVGGMANATLLAHGQPQPIGMFLVLASLLILASVIREHEGRAERRLLERSLLYSALAALLSAGFLFGVMSLIDTGRAEFGASALFLLFLAALAFEPLRQELQRGLTRIVHKDRAPATEVARALEAQEVLAEQRKRLAEIGALTAAVAHEVRNPLGVLSAHLTQLSRRGADAETVADMKEQIARAARFVDDLLAYGRPRAFELRSVDLTAAAALAVSSARQGAGFDAAAVDVDGDPVRVEADQAQLLQALVVLIDNALLAVEGRHPQTVRVRVGGTEEGAEITVEDDGPGIPETIQARLYTPFVSSRKREGPRPGTGLGLAIARGIIERHGGTIAADRGPLGGARFTVRLPRVQAMLTTNGDAP